MKSYTKVVITGGPSGGKTTLIEALKKELGMKCAVVPEAASILYRGGFPRHKEPQSTIHAQRAIIFTQRELEDLICQRSPDKLIVCDRGSLDSVAYWPETEAHFFESLPTNREKELARYDWVIHLDTATSDFYDSTNPIRTESFNEAQALNTKIKEAWAGHSQRIIINHTDDFLAKMTSSLAVIKAILSKKNVDEIKRTLFV